MPTTLGHWAAAHGWALARDARALQDLWPILNQCPLGAAAGFGTSWPIDRPLVARLLGFDAPRPNSLDAVSTRWETEARLAGALGIMMTHLSSLGQDLIYLTTPPREGVRLARRHVTGSSIMPHKRNPDFAEVTRARAAAVQALAAALAGVGRGALSGYNRDTQWTKYWVMDAAHEVGEAPELFAEAIEGLDIDRRALARAAAEGFSLAADLADRLAETRRLPFRRAYGLVAEAVAQDREKGRLTHGTLSAILRREKISPALDEKELADALDPKRAVARRASLGGPAPDDVRRQARDLTAEAASAERFARTHRRRLATARSRCGAL
jgi:argininosuccinate lyase